MSAWRNMKEIKVANQGKHTLLRLQLDTDMTDTWRLTEWQHELGDALILGIGKSKVFEQVYDNYAEANEEFLTIANDVIHEDYTYTRPTGEVLHHFRDDEDAA